jgi:hypothetical protein
MACSVVLFVFYELSLSVDALNVRNIHGMNNISTVLWYLDTPFPLCLYIQKDKGINTFAAIVDFSRFNNSRVRLLKISDDNE